VGDIQFGENPEDSNRYILVQRNYPHGRFTSPKSKRSRRVDLSKQLRRALLELRDKRMLEAFMAGRTSIADDLVFPSQVGTVIKPDNIVPRYMEPALERAGLRRFRFHDLRHTFGSLLIQDGASLTYVKEQMGHSSIQITVDTYGHLIPGADIACVDRLDSRTSPHQSAPETHQAEKESEQETAEVAAKIWLPPRDSNPDMLIQSQLSCR
jgi:integrase